LQFGTGSSVGTTEHRHFGAELGTASCGPLQTLLVFTSQAPQAFTSKKPLLSLSWQGAVIPETGTASAALEATSPHASPSRSPTAGGMTATEQSSCVEVCGLAPT